MVDVLASRDGASVRVGLGVALGVWPGVAQLPVRSGCVLTRARPDIVAERPTC